eukprot:15472570-Alexandrium_andersonii.AAC.2
MPTLCPGAISSIFSTARTDSCKSGRARARATPTPAMKCATPEKAMDRIIASTDHCCAQTHARTHPHNTNTRSPDTRHAHPT